MLREYGHDLTERAWQLFGDPRAIVEIQDASAKVSTNHVYRLMLEDQSELYAKVSSFGSYIHFRQDHVLIQRWIEALQGSRYERLLSSIAEKQGQVFTAHVKPASIAFYHPVPYSSFLPNRLSDEQVEAFAREMALFHAECARVAPKLSRSWKSLGSDIATLFDIAGNESWLQSRGFGPEAEGVIKTHCELFLHRAEALGYHDMPKIPILVDWNIGNFSVSGRHDALELFSRWDYDWFRIEPRILDFFFCARVVRDAGDQTTFSYLTDPLTEPRFVRFLRTYRQFYPLQENDLFFLKEVYRFFTLNYVVRSGEHFFRSSICERLQAEALHVYLPSIEMLSLDGLCHQVLT